MGQGVDDSTEREEEAEERGSWVSCLRHGVRGTGERNLGVLCLALAWHCFKLELQGVDVGRAS